MQGERFEEAGRKFAKASYIPKTAIPPAYPDVSPNPVHPLAE